MPRRDKQRIASALLRHTHASCSPYPLALRTQFGGKAQIYRIAVSLRRWSARPPPTVQNDWRRQADADAKYRVTVHKQQNRAFARAVPTPPAAAGYSRKKRVVLGIYGTVAGNTRHLCTDQFALSIQQHHAPPASPRPLLKTDVRPADKRWRILLSNRIRGQNR